MSDIYTTDQIVVAVELKGVYDGACCLLLSDGRIINRMTGFGGIRERRTAEWIAQHGDALRTEWGIPEPVEVTR